MTRWTVTEFLTFQAVARFRDVSELKNKDLSQLFYYDERIES